MTSKKKFSILRTVTCWCSYDPARREISHLRKYKYQVPVRTRLPRVSAQGSLHPGAQMNEQRPSNPGARGIICGPCNSGMHDECYGKPPATGIVCDCRDAGHALSRALKSKEQVEQAFHHAVKLLGDLFAWKRRQRDDGEYYDLKFSGDTFARVNVALADLGSRDLAVHR